MKVITIDTSQGEKLHTIDSVAVNELSFVLSNDVVEIIVSYAAENQFPSISMKEISHSTNINNTASTVQLVSIETSKGIVSVATNFNAAKGVFESLMGSELQKGVSPVESVAQSMKRVQFLQKCKRFETTLSQRDKVQAIQKAACKANGVQGYHDCHVMIKSANFDKNKERMLLDMLKSIEFEKCSKKKNVKLRSFLDRL